MNVSSQIAKHLLEAYFGNNWTCVDLKTQLDGVNWQQATTQVSNYNTIAALVFHIHYYVKGVVHVLQGKPLSTNDVYSFNHPPISNDEDWNTFIAQVFSEAKIFATVIKNLPEETLDQTFTDTKYGNYYRNLHGIIEHVYYHLGQIVLIKKALYSNEHPANH